MLQKPAQEARKAEKVSVREVPFALPAGRNLLMKNVARASTHGQGQLVGYSRSTTTISTRLLYARPSAVSFVCTGRVLPYAAPDSRSEGTP
jgi:hypothetical protein